GHDTILADVVWVIRKFQPDVIVARFPTTGEGGHGHHTASAILAGEAFANDVKIDLGSFNELLGRSYGEIAADSRSQHKSQGFGVAQRRGTFLNYFHLIAGDPVGGQAPSPV